MPNDLYGRDVLAWSEQQADLLRRLAREEQVSGVDWEHVIDEIACVGRTELDDLCSYLRRMLVHLLKAHGWPDSPYANEWRAEQAALSGGGRKTVRAVHAAED